MPAAPPQPNRAVFWNAAADTAFKATLHLIRTQDVATYMKFLRRVEHALELIADQPALGTATAHPGLRSFAIPKTGHSIYYRLHGDSLIVVRWFRQRRKAR